MRGIDRLHPHLVHGIVHDLGWRELRPVQEVAIHAVLDGANAVILAPTAGGKTEAALFPVLSRILAEGTGPVAALYLCPIRALLNNQEDRLRGYARMVGLDAFKWHGDVSDSRKNRFRAAPSHLLMTTPESLEVMMISARTDARSLFAPLSTVVVDEVHAFAGDDRGAHLAALLERLAVLCGRDFQRIGLSATVGNPLVIGEWLQGSSDRPLRLIDPPRDRPTRDLRVEFCDSVEEAAPRIAQLGRGRKSLVFVESRSRAERVAHQMSGLGVEVFVHHSSVSRADRKLAEESFASGSNVAIVCTSTMELGIDVGDLDQVIQVDAPATVASFLQRLGRTGRRPGRPSRCTVFCLSPETLLQSIAILALADSGWVEDIRPAAHAMHVLAHQVMALVLQEGGISRHRVLPWIDSAYPFATIRAQRLHELVDTMIERRILYETSGLLSLGERGEALYGRKNFFELYAVFSAPPMMRVLHGKDEVGHVQALFASMHDRSQGPLTFRLAGRAWEVTHMDWSRGILHVRPAEDGRVPSWLGLPGVLSTRICQAMREALIRDGLAGEWLGRSATEELRDLRESYADLFARGPAPLEQQGDAIVWHTFAGGGVNRLLAAGLERSTGGRWTAGNLSVRAKGPRLEAVMAAVGDLGGLEWDAVASHAARSMARGLVSKFQPCLPREAEDRMLAERLLDVSGARRFLAGLSPPSGLEVLSGVSRRLSDDEIGSALEPETAQSVRPLAAPKNEIVWVSTSSALELAVQRLQSEEIVGVDVETTLDSGTLCLIQIATRDATFVIDPLVVPALEPLANVLAGDRPCKVIHNARFKRRILATIGIRIEGVFDTLEASRRLRGIDALGGHSLASVVERELGVALDKSLQTSNWLRRPLSEHQIRYAALDAEILLFLAPALGRSGSKEVCRGAAVNPAVDARPMGEPEL